MAEEITVSKKEASQRQIHAAIRLTYADEYESAITLAHAAEGMLVGGKEPHFFTLLKAHVPASVGDEKRWVTMLNETAHWLKHTTPNLADEQRITKFQTWLMVMRAISKYAFTFDDETEMMVEFIDRWAKSDPFSSLGVDNASDKMKGA